MVLRVPEWRPLCADDGEIECEDLFAFERWHADRVDTVERELRAEGASEAGIRIWRAAWRRQIGLRTEQAKAI